MHNRPEFEAKLCQPAQLAGRIAALAAAGIHQRRIRHPASRPCHLPRAGACPRREPRGRSQQRRLGAAPGQGEDRPINQLEDRAAVLAALQAVDLVTWFDGDTPLALILACRPDVLVKGGDWKPEAIVGAREVIAWAARSIRSRSSSNARPPRP